MAEDFDDLSADSESSYLGADGAMTMLRALLHRVECRIGDDDSELGIAVLPVKPETARYESVWRRRDAELGSVQPAIPQGSLILVDSADLAAQLADIARRCDAQVFSTDPSTPAHLGTIVLNPQKIPVPRQRCEHVRIFSSAADVIDHWPIRPTPSLLRLQELALQIVKRLDPETSKSSVTALILDPLVDGMIHPYTSLLTGFIRAVSWERGANAFALVTDSDLRAGLAQLGTESAAQRDRPVVAYRNGSRHIERLIPAPIPQPLAYSSEGMKDLSVVVASGGARGITAEALKELARRVHPKIWLLGTTSLENVPEGILNGADDMRNELQAHFIKLGRQREPEVTALQLGRRFNRLWRIREISRNLKVLKELCGDDRVRYLVCDVTDRTQVATAAQRIHAEDEKVDVVIHGAGINRPASLDSKDLGDFRNVRDCKVLGYANLKEHLNVRGIWCNFGSLAGFTGWMGESDYAPANEFLSAAARYEKRLRRRDELTVGWTVWRDTGMGSAYRDLLMSRDMIGASNAEGRRHFIAELDCSTRPDNVSAYAGRAEVAAFNDLMPSYFPAASEIKAARPVLIEHSDTIQPGEQSWIWTPRIRRDEHLLGHVVNGHSVVPASILMAIASEAAIAVFPHLIVASMSDLDFNLFCPIDFSREMRPYQVRAETVSCGKGVATVRVVIAADVSSRDGRVLRENQEHCRMLVHLGSVMDTSRVKRQLPERKPVTHLLNPYYDSRSEVFLSGVYQSTWHSSTGIDHACEDWYVRIGVDEVLSQLPIPALLIDSMLRIKCFTHSTPESVSVLIAQHVDRIELQFHGNDSQIMQQYPTGLKLDYDLRKDMSTAYTPDGYVVAEIAGLELPVFGSVPLRSTTNDHRSGDLR